MRDARPGAFVGIALGAAAVGWGIYLSNALGETLGGLAILTGWVALILARKRRLAPTVNGDTTLTLAMLTPEVYARVTAVERRIADRQYSRWLTRLQGSGKVKYVDPQAEAAKAGYMFALYSLWCTSVPIAFVGACMISVRASGHNLLASGLVLVAASALWGLILLARWRKLRANLPGSARISPQT
ncbi:MAG: hypothetical protein M3N95_12245 [Actinomycetota bacterium]|nr:hypothetical protein [Actinomycetota bacterium]